MAFLTEAQARAATAKSLIAARQALRELRKLPRTAKFDVFLSHSYMDAQIISGIKELLEAGGLRVYVDWIEDGQLDRSNVTAETAELLRTRMTNSKTLIYAASSNSRESKWMPWELGYFDGSKPGHVAILPIVKSSDSEFSGQEYLGLYPYVENVTWFARRPYLAISTTKGPLNVREFASTPVFA